MAGHSHWANIKHKKGANDAKKAAVITQMGKLITVAVQLGGPDPDANPRLRLALSKARAQNMNRDAIKRAIDKAAGIGKDAKIMEDLVYEGYASNGVAVVAEVLSDNRNRTVPEIRKLFERGGGSLGAPGCVAWQFQPKSVFVVTNCTEDRVMEVLIEADADAEDIYELSDGDVSIQAAPEEFDAITDALSAADITISSSDLTKVPDNDVEIDDLETAQKIQNLLDQLESHTDVTAVYSNFAPTDEIAEQL
jgi:YebC/PmpR family DNA-binding regulatory protein